MSSSVVPILVASSQRDGKHTLAAYEAPRVAAHQNAQVLLDEPARRHDRVLARRRPPRARSGWCVASQRHDLAEQLGGWRRRPRVASPPPRRASREELSPSARAPRRGCGVDLEPLREVERAQAHRQAPSPSRAAGTYGKIGSIVTRAPTYASNQKSRPPRAGSRARRRALREGVPRGGVDDRASSSTLPPVHPRPRLLDL